MIDLAHVGHDGSFNWYVYLMYGFLVGAHYYGDKEYRGFLLFLGPIGMSFGWPTRYWKDGK